MRWGAFIFFLGLAVRAQSVETDPPYTIVHDGGRHVITLYAEASVEGDRLEIVDLIGRRVRTIHLTPVQEGDVITIPIPDLPEGLYYVRWIADNGRIRAVRRISIHH